MVFYDVIGGTVNFWYDDDKIWYRDVMELIKIGIRRIHANFDVQIRTNANATKIKTHVSETLVLARIYLTG